MNFLTRAVAVRVAAHLGQAIRYAHSFPISYHASFKVNRHESSQRGGRRRGPPLGKTNYRVFESIVLARYNILLERFKESDNAWATYGMPDEQKFIEDTRTFRHMIQKACDLAHQNITSRSENPLFWSLRNAFIQRDLKGLTSELQYSFHTFLMRGRFSKSVTASQRQLADMRFPFDWYPATRRIQRKIHLHVGPTNSGKTYHALKALEEAKSGIYAGPLRLLAHEVYSRFSAKGKACALITGEEQRLPDADLFYISCTVEMTPLNKLVDVAVIDEIQMLGDSDRGWSWTQALLGVQAKEVHLCGEERTVELVQSLCRSMGDECIVHRYQRLSPLQTMNEVVSKDFSNLQKGDAIVAFSRISIHGLKVAIEQATGRRCAIVYGSLPPEVRATQAALFNDPDNDYDFIVASDAIGMGLNLEIKRVIFESVHKRDSSKFRVLTVPELKQIGGRAGRFRSARDEMVERQSEGGALRTGQEDSKLGWVTCMEQEDLSTVRDAFLVEPEPLKKAYILPPAHILERFSTYFPTSTPLSFLLLRLQDIATLSPRFEISDLDDIIATADTIQSFNLSFTDRCVFINAPTSLKDYGMRDVVRGFVGCVERRSGGHLLDIKEIDLEILEVEPKDFSGGAGEYLMRLESLHKAITLYLWLSYRFTSIFPSQALAFHVRDLVQGRIEQYLSKMNSTAQTLADRREIHRKQAKKAARQRWQVIEGDNARPVMAVLDEARQPSMDGHEEHPVETAEESKDLDSIPADGGLAELLPNQEEGDSKEGSVNV
jgi:ATP-dependent RNA helicase SUPV3L1/SUV3